MRDEHHRNIGRGIVPLLFFSGALLVSLVIVRYVTMPQLASLADHRAQQGRLTRALDAHNGDVAIKKGLLEKQDSLVTKLNQLSGASGETGELSGLLRMIIAKANAANISFVKMQPQTETLSGTTVSYPIVLELTTSYNSLGRFVASLEALPYLVHVDRVAITAQRKNTLDIRVLVTCFFNTREPRQ